MTCHHFVPIAIEMFGVYFAQCMAITFFKELGQQTKFESGAAMAIQQEIRQLYSAPYQCDCFDHSTPHCFVYRLFLLLQTESCTVQSVEVYSKSSLIAIAHVLRDITCQME